VNREIPKIQEGDPMSHVSELREKRAKVHAYAVSLMAQKGGIKTDEDRQKFDKAMAEVDTLAADIQRYERAGEGQSGYLEIANRNPWTSEREIRAALAFGKYLRSGFNGMSDEDHKAMRRENRDGVVEGDILAQIGSYTGLGFLVPAGFVFDTENAMKYYAPLLSIVGRLDTATGNPLPYPISNDVDQEAEVIGESQSANEGDITADHIKFSSFKYSSKIVKASLELVQDSAFNLESWLAERFAIRFGRGYQRDLTNGDGNGKPEGILPSIAASGAVPVVARGSSETSGGSETGANSIGYTDLVRLEHSVDPAYRFGARFMLHDTSVASLKKILDKFGRPLWVPGIAEGAPDTIIGYPYVINQAMPQIGASNAVVAFGDLKKYLVRVVKGMSVQRLTERYAEKGQVAWLAWTRLDGHLLDAGTHPLNVLQNAS